MQESGNIIIFSDFAVFSSYPKDITLLALRKSILSLTIYRSPFPICCDNRILISIENINSIIFQFSLSSPFSLCTTIEILKGVNILLDCDQADFFCPDESF